MTQTSPPQTPLRATISADHRHLQASRSRYDDRFQGASLESGVLAIAKDLVAHIGFQQLTVFRLASALHRRGATPLAMLLTRIIRHFYGSEMHWAAHIEPGVMLVHGNGLVISRDARIDTGCVLSQNVTLGIGTSTDRIAGAPHLLANVHVAPGAVLVGPITVGPDSKIAPNVVVTKSVPERVVVACAPTVESDRAPSGKRT